MATNAENLNIILRAEVKDLNKKLNDANRRIDYFSKQANANLGKTTKAFDLLGAATSKLGITMSTGALATGMVRAMDNAIKTAVEIGNLSRVAGISTDAFQKFAYASQTVGIEQSKLSDILKDVNDKFGDYMATGAGPLADFFDNIAPKVGLTKNAFVGLSSDQALGKYVKALQDAGVNQQEMTFYMEALASDATALVPLLADNAAGLTRIGEEAAKAGALLDSGMIKNAENMQKRWIEVLGIMESYWNTFWLTIGMGIDEIFNITDEAKIKDQMAAVDSAIEDIKNYGAELQRFREANKNILEGGASPFKDTVVTELNALQNNLRAAQTAYQTAVDVANATKQRMDERGQVVRLTPVVTTEGYGTGGTAAAVDAAEKIIKAYDSVAASLNPLIALQAKYKQEQEAINAALAIGHISQARANELLDQAKNKYQKATGEAVDYSSAINAMASGLESSFMSLIDGSESFADSMKNTAAAVIRELYRVLVVQQLVNAAMGAFGYKNVGGTYIKTNASGGTLQAGTPSLVGENGPELIVPSRGSRILSHADTMNALGGGGQVVVNQTFQFSANGDESVKKIIAQSAPQIAMMTQQQIMDSRRRGGQMKAVFG